MAVLLVCDGACHLGVFGLSLIFWPTLDSLWTFLFYYACSRTAGWLCVVSLGNTLWSEWMYVGNSQDESWRTFWRILLRAYSYWSGRCCTRLSAATPRMFYSWILNSSLEHNCDFLVLNLWLPNILWTWHGRPRPTPHCMVLPVPLLICRESFMKVSWRQLNHFKYYCNGDNVGITSY